MNEAWLIFYGHKLNMSREETMNTRYGELLDMIACLAISNGAKPKQKARKMDIFEALSLR